jgi:hypothetical protein
MAVTYTPGQTVGRWTLLEYQAGKKEQGVRIRKPHWQCRCECGTVRLIPTDNLRGGFSKSCGHDRRSYAW